MIAKNRAQLKAWIKNMSEKVDVNENIILQNYMLERLLERISVSDYKYKFVLKGGDVNNCHCWNRYEKYTRYGCNYKRF